MIISLYVKVHNKTGLKYFGATTRDPYAYSGSGTRWLNHCRKHGFDITTSEVFRFENLEEAGKFALSFSHQHDIVGSEQWANLMPEDGLVHKASYPRSEATRRKISEAAKKRTGCANSFYGKYHSEETKKSISAMKIGKNCGDQNHFYGRSHSDATKAIMGDIHRGRPKPKEERAKLSQALRGLPKSEETKLAIASYAQKRKWIVNRNGQCFHTLDPINDPRLLSGEFMLGKKWKSPQA